MTPRRERSAPSWLRPRRGRLPSGCARAIGAVNSLGLRWRLFFLVLVALLPGLALILRVGIEQRGEARARAREKVERLADLVAEHGQRNLDLARAVLIGLGHTPQAESLDPEGCSQVARGIVEHFPLFANIGAAAADGRAFCSASARGDAPSAAERSFLERAASRRELTVGVRDPGGEEGPVTIHLAYPIVVGGEVRGAAFGAVDLAAMQAQLDALSLPVDAVVAVTDRRGAILARRPDDERWDGSAPGGLTASLALGGDRVAEARDVDGSRRLFAIRSVVVSGGEPGLYVVAGIPAALAGAAETELFHEVLTFYLLACVCALVLALVAGEFGLVRNVRAVIAAARRLSSGEYGARANRSRAGGELGELASAFDDMASNLESLTREKMSILEFAGDGILRLDVEGAVTYANPAAVRMLGGRAAATVGQRVNRLACHGQECRGGCVLARSLSDGVVHQGVDENFEAADGRRFAAEYVTTPIHHGGAVAGAVVVFRDVTERRRMEEKVRHTEKIQAIGQLAGGVTHDFNNILTAILSCARFVRDELPPGHQSRADVEEILSSSERGAALTRQLLTFSRREVVEPRVLDLGAVVSGVQSFLRRLIGEDVDIRVDVAPGCHVKADPGQMEQVIVNLAVNARDAMPAGGCITITVREGTPDDPAVQDDPALRGVRSVALTVADTGMGMEPTVAQRIFEPFYTTKPAGKGTGLGLSTVCQIAIQSGGTVRVKSSPGRGATFTVYLPYCDDSPSPSVSPPGVRQLGSGRVLLVEDDDVLRVLMRRALVAAGYWVADASRPSEALKVARDTTALDLLVTDVILPELSGPDLAARIVGLVPGVRVLYVSGYTGGRLAADEVVASGAAFLPKPFTPDVLLARVREVLEDPRDGAAGARRRAAAAG